MKIVTTLLIGSLLLTARNLLAQGNGVVNPVGQDQVLKIVSNLRQGMSAAETTNYLSKSGLRPCMTQNDHGIVSWFYAFTNSGTQTVRWLSPTGESKSADLPNQGRLEVQFEPKQEKASRNWRALKPEDCSLRAVRVHDTFIKLKKKL